MTALPPSVDKNMQPSVCVRKAKMATCYGAEDSMGTCMADLPMGSCLFRAK